MTTSKEELKKVLDLLRIEWEADQEEYKNKIAHTPLQERRKQGTSWYPVVVAESGFGMGDHLYLVIEKTTQQYTSHSFGQGKAVALFGNTGDAKNQPFIQGVVASVGFNSMKIVFANTDELPDWLDDGKLGVNLLFDETTYQEMEKATKLVMQAEKTRLAELREVLLGYVPAQFNPKVHSVTLPQLNSSQNEAVTNVLRAQDVAIVHGPPGTGKTTTLVEAILLTLKQEKRVLVCAPSNTAVDLLTEKLAARGVDVLRIGNPARVSDELLKHTVDVRVQEDKNYARIKQMRRQADELNRMAHKYKRHFGKAEREQRKLILTEARKLSKEANDTEKYIIDTVFDRAQVITCTLVGAANRILVDKTFETIFIDEAAQALEPGCWIPILKAKKVILAGDHCQLPPTVKSQKAEREGLGVTLFEKCIKRQQADVMLRTQYRMNELIMNFSSIQFYHGELLADNSVKTAVLGDDGWLEQPLTFIDTAGCGFDEKFNPENQSISNPEEANMLLKHLNILLEHVQQIQPELVTPAFRAGIISPYRAQVEYLQEQLPHFASLAALQGSISVGTVDGFQGQEREIIYISLVRSNSTGEIGFLNDIRRMNVALTRAKKKLVVIGDSATLSNHSFYQAFLDYVMPIGAYQSAWEFME